MNTELTRELAEIKKENLRLRAVADLGRTLADPSLGFSQKLDACLKNLAGVIRAEKASLMLLEGEQLVVKAATDPQILGSTIPLDQESISTRVVNYGQAFYSQKVAETPYANMAREGDQSSYRTGSLMSIPLMEDDLPLGVLNLSDKEGAPHFDQADLELAREIAAQLSRLVNFSQMHNRLDHAYNRLSRTQKDKDDLMHLIFHDMKAPITAVKEILNLLREPEGMEEEAREQFLDLAQGDLEMLWRRLSNLLDLNRMDSGQYPLKPEPVELGGLVEEVVRRMEGFSRVNQVEVDLNIEDKFEPMVDEDLTERLVVNLLTNALRHSSPENGGQGKTRIELSREDGRILLKVIDSGPGVDPRLGQSIFERFKQSGAARGSSGLGLYFCRRAAWLMGGSVNYENLPQGGASFVFSLPAA